MEQPLVIEIFKVIFKPIIKLLGYILCIPQLVLKKPKLAIVDNYQCNNILQIIITVLLLLVYHTIYLNFHIIYFLKNYSLVQSNFEIFLALVIFYSFTATFYYTEDIRYFILKDMGYLLLLLSNILVYILVFFSFFIRFDSFSLKLIFEKNMRVGIGNLDMFFVNPIFYFFETLFIALMNLLIATHLINPLSWLRIANLFSVDCRASSYKIIVFSFFMIIFDFIIIICFFLNIPFIFSFISDILNIVKVLLNSRESANLKPDQIDFFRRYLNNNYNINRFFNSNSSSKRYLIIGFKIILDSFVSNYGFLFEVVNKYFKPFHHLGRLTNFIKNILRYFIVFVFSILNLIIFWRIKEIQKNLNLFKANSSAMEYSKNCLASFLNGISDIFFFSAYLMNRIIIFNYLFLKFHEKNIIENSQRFNQNQNITKYFLISQQSLKKLTNKESFSLLILFKKEGFFSTFLLEEYSMIKILNFQAFFVKSLDLFISLLSFLNILSPTFYIKIYNYLKYKSFFNSKNHKKNNPQLFKDKELRITNRFISNFYLFPLLSVSYHQSLNRRFLENFEADIFKKLQEKIDIFKDTNLSMKNYACAFNIPLFSLSRRIVIRNTFNDFIYGILFFINFITLLDPFTGLCHIYNIFKLILSIKLSLNYQKSLLNSKISNIIAKEIKTCLALFINFGLNIFFYIPLVLLSIILFPFNLFKIIIFIIENYFLLIYKKIRNISKYVLNLENFGPMFVKEIEIELSSNQEELENLLQKKIFFVKNIFRKFVKSWSTLIKFILIHISVIRAVYLYCDLYRLKKFYNFFLKFIETINNTDSFLGYIAFMNKSNDNKSIYEDVSLNHDSSRKAVDESESNNFVCDNISHLKLLRELNSSKKMYSKKYIFIYFDYVSWLNFFNYITVSNKLSFEIIQNKSEKIISSMSLTNQIKNIDIIILKKMINENINLLVYLENIIDDNFAQLWREIIFYPIIVFAYITNPIIFFQGFLNAKSSDYIIFRQRKFSNKFMIFLNTCLEHFKIIINLVKMILITITIIKLPDLILLIYYNLGSILTKDNYYKAQLETNFEGKYSHDLSNLLKNTFEFYFIIVLFVINLLLILRIFAVIRRTSRFLLEYAKKMKYKFLGEKIKRNNNSQLESTKMNCFVNIVEYLKPKDIGRVMLINKTLKKRIDKNLIWENLFNNYFGKKINDYKQYINFQNIYNQITENDDEIKRLENNLSFTDIESEKNRLKDELDVQLKALNQLKKNFDNLVFRKLEFKYQQKGYNLANLENIYGDFIKKNFDYKVLCQKAQNEFNYKNELSEKMRDKFIGLTNVLIEETFESIFKFPHLILMPLKIFSIPILYLRKIITIIYVFVFDRESESRIEKYNSLNKELFGGQYFYNIQLVGFFSIFLILFDLLCAIIILFDKMYCILLNIFSLQYLFKKKFLINHRYNNNNLEIGIKRIDSNLDYLYDSMDMKYYEILFVLWQYIIAGIVLFLHILIVLIPSIFFKFEGIKNIIHKAFLDNHRMENHNLYRTGSSPLFSALNWYILFDEIFNILWSMSLLEKYFLIVGKYFSNVPFLMLTVILFTVYSNSYRNGETTQSLYYLIASEYIKIFILYIFSVNSFYNLIFPHIFVFNIYKLLARRLKILDNKLILNVVSLIVILFPFYLNFKVKLTFFRFFIVNTWAITSFVRLSKQHKL